MTITMNIGDKTKNIIVCTLKNISVISGGKFKKPITNNINVNNKKMENNLDIFFTFCFLPFTTDYCDLRLQINIILFLFFITQYLF